MENTLKNRTSLDMGVLPIHHEPVWQNRLEHHTSMTKQPTNGSVMLSPTSCSGLRWVDDDDDDDDFCCKYVISFMNINVYEHTKCINFKVGTTVASLDSSAIQQFIITIL